jgi:hypothetical protein
MCSLMVPRLVTTGRAFNHLTTTTLAMTPEATNRERIELQCSRVIDHLVELEVVFLDANRALMAS